MSEIPDQKPVTPQPASDKGFIAIPGDAKPHHVEHFQPGVDYGAVKQDGSPVHEPKAKTTLHADVNMAPDAAVPEASLTPADGPEIAVKGIRRVGELGHRVVQAFKSNEGS